MAVTKAIAAPPARGANPPRLWLLAVFAGIIGLYGLSYLAGHPAPPGPATNHAGRAWLVLHAASAGSALLIGPWQFFATAPWRRSVWHRWMGRAYVVFCITGGLAGMMLALNASSGDFARAGFGLLAALWLTTTVLAWLAARRGDYLSHRRWMIRSFALAFAAVTLRLELLATLIPHVSFFAFYPWTAWISWIPNLIVADVWLRTHGPDPRFEA